MHVDQKCILLSKYIEHLTVKCDDVQRGEMKMSEVASREVKSRLRARLPSRESFALAAASRPAIDMLLPIGSTGRYQSHLFKSNSHHP